MDLKELLQARLTDGRPFGVCPWEDGDGMLWGVLQSLDDEGFRVLLVDPLGREEGTESYAYDDVSSFDFGESYGERLRRLSEFEPTRPALDFLEATDAIASVLNQALTSGEIVTIKTIPDDQREIVRVRGFNSDWITVQHYDDLMTATAVASYRLSRISAVRAGSATEEAELFVESKNKNSPAS